MFMRYFGGGVGHQVMQHSMAAEQADGMDVDNESEDSDDCLLDGDHPMAQQTSASDDEDTDNSDDDDEDGGESDDQQDGETDGTGSDWEDDDFGPEDGEENDEVEDDYGDL